MRRNTQGITAEQEAYIIVHKADYPRTEVARAAGVSVTTLYRVLRRNGGTIDHNRSMKLRDMEDKVRELFPTMSALEVGKRIGRGKSTVIRWAKRLGVTHTKETAEALLARQRHNLLLSHTREVQERRARKWLRTRRYDEFLKKSGMRQRTRLRIASLPLRTRRVIWYLGNKYGYFSFPDEAVAYYDGETRRCHTEAYYTERYGIRFEAADE